MYNLVYDLFNTTCTSGIQQVGLWQNRVNSAWAAGAGNANNLYTYVDTNLKLTNGTYFTGVKITSTTSGTFKVKLARTRDLSQWDLYDVVTVTHMGGTGNYIFQPHWIPDDSRSYYVGFYSAVSMSSAPHMCNCHYVI
jgi:hypothetical protein